MEKEGTNSSKWLWIALVVVVLIVAGFFGWYFWQKNATQKVANIPAIPVTSNTSIANWKTYTSKVNSYSVKYPADWTIKLDGTGSTSLAIGNPAYIKALFDYKAANPNGGNNPPAEDFILNYYSDINALQCGNMGDCTSVTTRDANLADYIGSLSATTKLIGNNTFYETKQNQLGQPTITYYIQSGAHIYGLTFYNLTSGSLSSDQSNILGSFTSPI